jgi:hypothetical protein
MAQMIRAVVLLCALCSADAGQAQGRSDAFRAMLAHVPVSFLGPLTDRWEVMFGDVTAGAVAVSAPPEGANPIFTSALGPLARAAVPPLTDVLRQDALDIWPDLLGFGPDQVVSMLTITAPPQSAILLQLTPGATPDVGPALIANGYVQTSQIGSPAYVRGDQDFAFDIAARNPADPFGGGMGLSSRIAIQGDILLQSRDWPMLTEMTATDTPKLGDNPEIAAMLNALDGMPDDLGGLVRARLMTDPLVIGAWDPLAGLQIDEVPDLVEPPKTRLPFWSLGLIADLATDETETAVIALVYATQTDAVTAAASLQSAWRFQLSAAAGRSFEDITGAVAVTSVSGTGPFVVLLTATLPTEVRGGMIDNRPWSVLIQAYYQRDLAILAPNLP